MQRYLIGRASALVLIVALVTSLAPIAWATHGENVPQGYVDTIAGGLGRGDALRLQFFAEDLQLHGDLLYFVDGEFNVVRRMSVGGPDVRQSEVVAGMGGWNFSLNPVPNASVSNDTLNRDGEKNALAHRFGQISGITTDPAGNLYISDMGHDVVWRVDPAGTMTRVAGNRDPHTPGQVGRRPVQDAVEVAAANDVLPARQTMLTDPSGLAIDASGDLYIAEGTHYRIRKVDMSAGTISTFVGPPVAARERGCVRVGIDTCPVGIPGDLAFDGSGNLIVGTWWPGAVFSVAPDRSVTVLAHVSSGVSDVATDGDVIYYSDPGPTDELVALRSASETRTPITLGGEDTQLTGIAAGGGRVFVSGASFPDSFPHFPNAAIAEVVGGDAVRIAGAPRGVAGGDGGPASDAQLFDPSDVVHDNAGNFYVTSRDLYDLRRISCDGSIMSIAIPRIGPNDRVTIAEDPFGNAFLVLPEQLYRIDPDTAALMPMFSFQREYVEIESAVVDSRGHLILSYWGDLLEIDPATGVDRLIPTMTEEGEDLLWPNDLAVDTDGALLLAIRDSGGIFRLPLTDDGYGVPTRIAGSDQGFAFSKADLSDPAAAIERNRRALEKGLSGSNTGSALDTNIAPEGVALAADGDLLVADTGTQRVLRLDRDSQMFTVIAGADTEGDLSARIDNVHVRVSQGAADDASPDGKLGTETVIENLAAVTSDPRDNIIFVDQALERVRYVAGTGPVLECGETVEKVATSLTYTGSTQAKGSSIELAANLTAVDGTPLADQAIVFTVAGRSYEAVTDATGTATATADVPEHGKSQTVTVAFLGTDSFEPTQTSAVVWWGNPKT